MNIIDNIKLEEINKITWGILFPSSFCDELKKHLDPQRLSDYLKEGETRVEMQKVLIRMLLSEDYRTTQDGSDITSMGFSQFNKYYNKAEGLKKYNYMTARIFHQAKAGKYDFHSSPFIQQLKEHLQELFHLFPEDYRSDYMDDLGDFIALYLDDYPVLQDHKQDLIDADFYDRITALTAVAFTWPSWENKKTAEDLSYFLLPEKPVPTEENPLQTQRIISYVKKENQKASDELAQAYTLYQEKNYAEAAAIFLQILSRKFADDTVLRDAYYYLAICMLDHNSREVKNVFKGLSSTDPFKNIHPTDLLKEASRLGHSAALERLRIVNAAPEPVSLIQKLPFTHGTARIFFNSPNSNTYMDAFIESLPEEMQDYEMQKKMITKFSSKNDLLEKLPSVRFTEDCRFLLFDNDPEKNFRDFLYILDYIASFEKADRSDKAAVPTPQWYKTSIYIRVKESDYSALIDTAMQRLGDFPVRVFIIDDAKWAAQYLLYQHPLFKPLQYIPAARLRNNPITLNFTILCDQNIDLTCWLIREAYWLGCFHYDKITLSFHVISPHAMEIASKLRYDCPDIFSKVPDYDSTSKVILDRNSFITVSSMTSDDVFSALMNCETPIVTNNYYVVNVGKSVENLNFATKLREWTIREAVNSGGKLQNNALPFISFYCQDPEVAHLAQHLVVQNVTCGDQWFNNYNLVPFGTLTDRYSWVQLDGGYLEDVAESTHLQYCGTTPSDSQEKKLNQLKSYFSRSYNRDSSMAVALSMPYRLFQINVGKYGHIFSLDQPLSTDFSPKDIDRLVETVTSALTASDTRFAIKQELLRYEHSRWMRWTISRGWKAASSEQVIHYMKSGNPKHQLYIARLHGCICDLDMLPQLAQDLCDQAYLVNDAQADRYADKELLYGAVSFTPKDFMRIDKSNIEATGDIIARKWMQSIEK